MNEDRPVQLTLPPPKNGVLTVPFKGPSTREDVKLFKEAIDAQLDVHRDIDSAIFDLSEIHPHVNSAGRILDLACEYHENHHLTIEVRMQARIYNLLQMIEPHNMPKSTGTKPVRVRGVSVIVLNKTPKGRPGELERHFAASPTQVDSPVTLLLCECRICSINGSTITVSLDTKDGEVIAEFERVQFPKGPLAPGMMFEYRAIVTEPGQTQVSLDRILPQQATVQELSDEIAAIGKELPGLEKLDA